MNVLRVFPRKTSMTPNDVYAFIGDPPLWRPRADEVHISCTFTWDIEEAKRLRDAWGQYYPIVKLGGPAISPIYNDPYRQFTPGKYVKNGITFTTRGCNNECPWCLVPEREGKLIEIKNFAPGHIVQDNNLLQASRSHLRSVFGMLKAQRRKVTLSGGLDARLIDDWVAEELRGLRIKEIFLAADTEAALVPLRRAVVKLSFLSRRQLRCYVLIAYRGETVSKAEERLEAVWQAGCLPFAQLYQPSDRYIDYPSDWKALARTWCRPAAMFALHNSQH